MADPTSGKRVAEPQGAPPWFDKNSRSAAGYLPGLTDAMAAVAKAWTARFGILSAAPGEILLQGLSSETVERVTARADESTTFASLWTPDWNTTVALRFDRAVVTATVEALFGGAGEEDAAPNQGPLSPVETRIADVIGKQAAEALTDGLSDLLPTTVLFEQILPKLDLAALGKPNAALLIARFVLTTLGRAVHLDVLIPQTALEPLNDKLLKLREGAAPAPDLKWSEQLEAEVNRAIVRVEASIEASPMSLGDLAALRPGQVLALPVHSGSKVRLKCENGELFRCDLGQTAGHYTVRLVGPASAGTLC